MELELKYKRAIVLILCISMILPSVLLIRPKFAYAATKGICIATSSLNVRTGPGTAYEKVMVDDVAVSLKPNQEVTILGKEGDWYKISGTYSGKEFVGYAISTYIKDTKETMNTDKPATASTQYQLNAAGIITALELNLRSGAGTTFEKLGTLTMNSKVTITGVAYNGSDRWYQVKTSIQGVPVTGYLLAIYVKLEGTSGFFANVATADLSLQKEAGANKEVLITLVKDRLVWVISESTINQTKWFYVKVTINNVVYKGYVPAESITFLGTKVTTTVTPTQVPAKPTPTVVPTQAPVQTTFQINLTGTVTSTTLNVRSDASTRKTKVATIAKGASVTILTEKYDATDKWYQIRTKHNGKTITGYVLSDYVAIKVGTGFYAKVKPKKLTYKASASNTAKNVTLSNGEVISRTQGSYVWVSVEKTVSGEKWFRINYHKSGAVYYGYVKSTDLILIGKTKDVVATPTPTVAPTEAPDKEPTITPMPTVTGTPNATPTVKVTPTPKVSPTPSVTPTPTAKLFTAQGIIINTSGLGVKEHPKLNSGFVKNSSDYPIILISDIPVTVQGEFYEDQIVWYAINFNYGDGNYTGYINSSYVKIDSSTIVNGGSGPTAPTPAPTTAPSSVDFETSLAIQGFPDSYKTMLRSLHQQYPNWQFEAFHTGLNWDTVITNQGIAGKNLIPNSKGIEWKSLETGAYNWKTDSFIVYDGSSWVTASKAAVAYYMDPRNFLTPSGIFQFEMLKYKESYQNLVGVENILKNTPMYQTSYSYIDTDGSTKTITYGQTFLEAARYSGVSPYHLASRVKQEVVTGASTFSNSVSGTVSGLEGLYNFFNIGAYHSTVAGGAIANGLKYARDGGTSASMNVGGLIPWTNRYRSIVGGAYIIGNSYINRGQDTIYLQKFNVTSTSTYSHQYMANVEAPFAEGKKVFAGYSNVSDLPIVFSIPVYLNMPATPCLAPTTQYNPNNYLKTLTVTDASGNAINLTPTFNILTTKDFSIVLGNKQTSITINAACVSTKAVANGMGTYPVNVGLNEFIINVTAQNGDIRQYKINVVRESQ